MKQTAVEWFYRWINDNQEATLNEALKAFEQAKAMEKEQIEDAYTMGSYDMTDKKFNPSEYYNETYTK